MSGLVKAAKKVVKGVVNAVKSVVKAVANVVKAVVNFVAQPFMGPLGGMGGIPSASSEAQRQEGVLVTSVGGGTNFIPVIYGIRQVGGTVVFVETGETKNKFLWVAYALSEGPVEAMYDLSIDDEDVTTANFISRLNAGEQVSVDKAGRYLGRAVFQFFPGEYFANPLASNIRNISHLLTQAPSWKKSSSVMNGLCVLLARYEWREATTQEEADNNPFSGNIPNIKATLLGRKVARLTQGTPENSEYGASGYTESYSYNPAECLLDYLRNPRYGKGLKNRDIDWPSFKRAADKFNQRVTYIDGVQGPILTMNTVVDTGNTLMSNVKVLLQGMRSYLPYVQGKYKLKVEDAGNELDILSGVANVVATFTKEDIVGDITYSSVERSNKYSEVEVTYVSPPDKWANQSVVFPTTDAERQRFVDEDGGRKNRGSFTFPTLINYAMAYDMARLLFNKSRFQQTCTFRTTLRAMELEPGDTVRINGNILDFGEDIPWRIISLQLNSDQTYTVSCVRNPDFIYPHSRAGEKDEVLPPYIPRGAAIYFPGIYYNVGLNPPDAGYWQPGQRPGDGIVGFPNPIPVVPGDPPFEGLPVPFPTVRVIVDRLDYTFNGDLFDVRFSYLQPDHPHFSHVEVFYKRDLAVETQFKQEIFSSRPGANRAASGTIKNLLKGPWNYIVLLRVHFTNNISIAVTRVYVDAASVATSATPVDYVEYYQQGWRPPTQQNPGFQPEKNAMVGTIVANPLFSGIVPVNPRQLKFTVTQDLINSSVDTRIAWLVILYRPVGSAYWFKTRVLDPLGSFGFSPGSAREFNPILNLGATVYPGPDDASDNYDFVFRLGYNDDTESTRQLRLMNVDIERDTGPVDVFAGVTRINEVVTAFEIITVDQAPPGTVVDPTDVRISINAITQGPTVFPPSGGQVQTINFKFDPLPQSNLPFFRGIRIRWRPAGSTLPLDNFYEFSPQEVLQLNYDLWLYREGQALTPPPLNQRVEYVVEVLILNASGMTSSSQTNAIYLAGEVHTRTTDVGYPVNGNWLPTFTVFHGTLTQVLNRLGAVSVPPANDTTSLFTPSFVRGATILDGGLPKPDLEISITVRNNFNPNGDVNRIAGVKIYYRESFGDFPFFKESEVTTNNYPVNDDFTFTFPESLGERLYPALPTTNQNRYDFIFRFLFTDGTESISQSRFMGVPVERNAVTGTYQFDPFAAGVNFGRFTESANSYEFTTERNAPPGSFLNTKDILPPLLDISNDENNGRLTWFVGVEDITPAEQNFFLGMTIRYRQLPIDRPAGDFIVTETSIPLRYSAQTNVYSTEPLNYIPDERYQFILTPKVSARNRNTGVIEQVDGNFSYFMQGTMRDIFPRNWRDRLALNTISTSEIAGLPVPPLLSVVSVLNYQRRGSSTNLNPNRTWIELHIDPNNIRNLNRPVAGLQNIRVYRRSRIDRIGDGRNAAKYWGLGRWEYIDLDTSSIGNTQRLADGTLIVRLRNPISYTEFNQFYEITADPLTNRAYPWWSDPPGNVALEPVTGVNVEFYITVFQRGIETPYGVMLGSIPTDSSTSTERLRIVDVSELNSVDAGYRRRLTEGVDGARPRWTGGTLFNGTGGWVLWTLNATTGSDSGRPIV